MPPEESTTVNDYDLLADTYTRWSDTEIQNAYYERPAVLALAGDVAGRRILDAGCGAGPLTVALRERGAEVSGFDLSSGMLEIARQRLGPDVDLRVADVAEPLPYADNAFDDVVASLVLHYLEDWGPALAEFHRVLKPGGRLIVVVDHPYAIHMLQRQAGQKTDYSATYEWTETWEIDGRAMPMSFWNRPLHAMTDAFTAAGFRISVLSEPKPVQEAEKLFPEDYRMLCVSPSCLFFVLQAE